MRDSLYDEWFLMVLEGGVRSDLKAGAERYKLFSCNFVLLSNMHISTI